MKPYLYIQEYLDGNADNHTWKGLDININLNKRGLEGKASDILENPFKWIETSAQ